MFFDLVLMFIHS